jgi:hypothetical protein
MITNTLLLQRVSLLMMNRWILEPICRKIWYWCESRAFWMIGYILQ